jgi:alkylated DNA repair dioxygenase AlkB
MTTPVAADAFWIERDFISPGEAADLWQPLQSIAWDSRFRARKSMNFGAPYNYSGLSWPRTPLPDWLLTTCAKVENRLGYEINNCLANYYPDGTSTMGFHADDTRDLADGTGIAVLSLGTERQISFRLGNDRTTVEHHALPPNSLLFMSADMQGDWKHAILADPRVVEPRISLTFRQLRE